MRTGAVDSYGAAARPLAYAAFIAAVLSAGLAPALAAAAAGLDGAGSLVAVHLLATASLAALLANRSVKAALVLLAVLMPWQPLLSMPLAEALGSSGTRLLVATKEVYAAVLLAALFISNARKVRWGWADAAGAVFLLAYLIYAAGSPASMTIRIVSFKEGFMLGCFYFIGRLCLLTRDDIVWFLRVVIVVSALVAAFGYFERFLFDGGDWAYIGAVEYFETKLDTSRLGSVTIDGLPLNWYTYLGNVPVRRMVGPIGDATSLSRFLALPLLALLYIKGIAGSSRESAPVRLALVAFLAAALALTLGRGGQIIAIGALLVLMFARRPALSLLLGVPAVVLAFTRLSLFDLQSGSAIRHLAGLAKGMSSIIENPLGNGLGTSGQMAVLYSARVGERVEESYLGSLAYQMGLPGILIYTGFFLLLTLALLKAYLALRKEGGRDSGMALLAFAFSAGIYMTSVLANSAIAPISAGLSLIYIGAFAGTVARPRQRKVSSC